jgi:hypothetical protein
VLFGVDLVESLPRVQDELDALGDGHPLERADLLSTLAIGRMWAGAHADARNPPAPPPPCSPSRRHRRAHGMRLLEADAVAADGDTAGSAGLLDALLATSARGRRRVRVLATRPGSTASPRSSPRARPPPMRRRGSRCRSA